MPHPTLVGGANPQVRAAGIVDIRGGRIYSADNTSGHFKPARVTRSCRRSISPCSSRERVPSQLPRILTVESLDLTEHFVGKWGFYPWSPEHQEHHGPDTIHPGDLNAWSQSHPYGGLFECVGVDGGYLILAYGKQRFRVRPQLFRKVARPSHRIGDVVQLESKGQIVRGVVVKIQWHHQKNEPFFFIEKEGKPSSKRYWDSDFR